MLAFRFIALLVLVSVLLSCEPTRGLKAVSAKEIDWEATQTKMMEAGQTSVHHTHLAQFVGDWKVKVSMLQVPGATPEVMEGTTKFHMILDGHALQQDFHGNFMEQPFTGLGLTGYDVLRGKYWSTWTDSMSTNLMPMSEGTCSADGKVLTFLGEWDHPFLGVRASTRETWTLESPSQFTFRMFHGWHGQPEYEHMTIVYTR